MSIRIPLFFIQRRQNKVSLVQRNLNKPRAQQKGLPGASITEMCSEGGYQVTSAFSLDRPVHDESGKYSDCSARL